jgi:DNA processing protein
VSFGRLLGVFGTAGAVLHAAVEPGGGARLVAATASDGSGPTLTPSAARAIADLALHPDAILRAIRRAGVDPLLLADEDFPSRLRRIELPPPVLFVRGPRSALERSRAIAVVGTRRPTEAGRSTAARIAEAVARRGATVVSGLAVGIDAAAHRAAIRAEGPTVAVIGGGHERLYPASHHALVDQIVAGGGAVISEFAPETSPSRGTFPRRNRLISGLADATVVVEAGARSGALTTAAWALEQGRELHIVPGRLDDPAVAGSLAFLREAGPEARVVAGIAELVHDLGLDATDGPHGMPVADRPTTAGGTVARPGTMAVGGGAPAILATLPPAERSIAVAVRDGLASVDELVASTGLGGAAVLGALTALELRGIVVEVFGRYRASGVLAAESRWRPVPATRPNARHRSAAGIAGPTGMSPDGR